VSQVSLIINLQDRQSGYYCTHFTGEETEAKVSDLPGVAKVVIESEFAARSPHSKPICFKVLCTELYLPVLCYT